MSQSTIHYDDENRTRTWECRRCGGTVTAWCGRDTQCGQCHAKYNGFGQRLRDDWDDNPSAYDENIGDIEGSEMAAIAAENDQ